MSALPSIDTLYESHSGRIFGYCLRRLPNREEAEDAVQQTFMNAYRGLSRGVVPRSETAWLFKIAENVCRERRRSAWRRSQLELVQDPDGMASLAVAPQRTHDELAGLADALAELSPNQQRAILLREWQGLSYREIAEELELTEGAVETLLFRARRSLARKLDRSRGQVWSSLGTAGAWAKSLFGGAAAKIAATAVVAAGIAAATPAVRHELGWSSHSTARSHKVAAPPVQAPDPRPPAAAPAKRTTAHHTARKGHVRGAVPRTGPKRTPPAGSPPAADTPPAPPSQVAPPPPPNVQVPPVQVPDPPQLPVQLPPAPPLPPVNVPGGVPPLPPLPPLPLP
jgi:RNA polymerase sigma-70 factor (ECF subfamily)